MGSRAAVQPRNPAERGFTRFRPSCEASLSLNQGLRKASQREEILATVLAPQRERHSE